MEDKSRSKYGGILGNIVSTYREIDEKVGKKIFGNPVGFSRNFKGNSKLNTKIDKNLLNENPELYNLRKEHCLLLGQPFKKSIIENISKKYNQLIDDDEFSFKSEAKGVNFMRTIYNAPKSFPEVSELIDDNIKKLLEGYYQNQNFSILHVDCRRHFHVPDEIGSKLELFGLKWHCDWRTTDQIKLFIYLSDVTEEDGPFHAQSKERTSHIMKMGYYRPENYNVAEEVMEESDHITKVTGPKGTAFFANSNILLHKAGNPKLDHQRDVIAFSIQAADKPLGKNWLENVTPIGAEMQEMKKRAKS